MSCDVAASALLFLASLSSGPAPGQAHARMILALNAAAPAAASRLAGEPLYADIIGRARTLKARVESYRHAAPAATLPDWDGFKAQVAALSALDMKGHLDLAARGTDGDLKCILKGISQDLPKKLADLDLASGAAAPPASREAALRELGYLLNDNVEVLTAPPAKPV